jgi:hypothetical protein
MALENVEQNVTAPTREPLVIEITEDAYKQNSVYRPWDEARTGAMPVVPVTSLTPQQALKMLAAVSRELAAGVMPA